MDDIAYFTGHCCGENDGKMTVNWWCVMLFMLLGIGHSLMVLPFGLLPTRVNPVVRVLPPCPLLLLPVSSPVLFGL